MIKILVSNDDGVTSKGLAVLVDQLSKLAQVTVVAPDRNCSAASNSVTLDRPLRIIRQENGFYAVNGTPTDCVHLAITGWLDKHPDMVVSGINIGANLGDDVLYSGTVAAAMEGRFMGYPAMAVSLTCDNEIKTNGLFHFETAAIASAYILKKLLDTPLPKDTILNINVPNLPLAEIKGFKVARLGHRHIAEQIIPTTDPRGDPIYWIGPVGREQDAGEGTDFYAISQGFVSITPIKTDLTDYAALDDLTNWSSPLTLKK